MIPLTMAILLACLPHAALQVQQREIRERGIHYSIDVKYPEIEGADAFNATMRQAVDSLTGPFKKGEVDAPGVPVDSYLKGSYSVAILKNGIVSALLEYEEYGSGAAHPWDVMASVNYDSRTCRVLALSDLFRPRANYVSRISQLAIATLDENEFADHGAIRHGAGPLESNFKVFTLTDTSLVLHFPMYQVAAGAAGAQSVAIPLEKLTPVLQKR